MVTGIKSFKEWFKGNEEQYTIIGGSYVKDTKDAYEKYNFKPEHLKLKGFPEGVLDLWRRKVQVQEKGTS